MDVQVLLSGIHAKTKAVMDVGNDMAACRARIIPGAIRYDVDAVQSSGDDYRTEQMLDDLNRLEARKERLTADLESDLALARKILDEMGECNERRVLQLYYLVWPPKTWFEVAQEMNYDERWVYRLRERALNQAEAIYQKYASIRQYKNC